MGLMLLPLRAAMQCKGHFFHFHAGEQHLSFPLASDVMMATGVVHCFPNKRKWRNSRAVRSRSRPSRRVRPQYGSMAAGSASPVSSQTNPNLSPAPVPHRQRCLPAPIYLLCMHHCNMRANGFEEDCTRACMLVHHSWLPQSISLTLHFSKQPQINDEHMR
jgi:hypothetical protein